MLRRTRLLKDVLEGMKKGQSKGGVRKKMFIFFLLQKRKAYEKYLLMDGIRDLCLQNFFDDNKNNKDYVILL